MKISILNFIIIYLGSIFLFAFFYSLMPYSFYHTTVQYEKFIQEGITELEPDLLTEIKENLRTDPNSDSVVMKGARFSLKNISISELTMKNSTAYFSMSIAPINTDKGEILTLGEYHLDFENYDIYEFHDEPHTAYIYEDSPLSFWYGGRIGLFFKKNNFSVRPDTILEYDSLKKPTNDYGFLLISDGFLFKLNSYSKAQKGFPSYTKGNFARMFYLSAVTITTVGYGDIVPITTLARILLSIEAIWGILIIGFFLNSLVQRIKQKP